MFAKRYGLRYENESKIDATYEKANKKIYSALSHTPNVSFLDLEPLFPHKNLIPQQFTENGSPLYFDDDHLNAYGGEWLAKKALQNKKYQYLEKLFNIK